MPALDPTLIDDEDVLARHDSRGVLRSLATAGAQVREAVRLSSDAGIAGVAGGSRPRSVLVAATGGTAIVGDALGWFAGAGSPVPIDTRSHGPLPGWVGSLDLVIAVSQSGRAAGPVSLAAEAARRGAFLLTVGAPDSPLAAVCAQARGVHVDVPTTRTSSRTALWSMRGLQVLRIVGKKESSSVCIWEKVLVKTYPARRQERSLQKSFLI